MNQFHGKFVYLAAPYSIGDKRKNVANSIIVTDKLMNHGATVYNPLLSHFHDAVFNHPPEFWYSYDLKWLERCDCLIWIAGESQGVKAEIEHALKLDMPVYEWGK